MALLSLANHSDYANCISVSVSVKELIRCLQGAPLGYVYYFIEGFVHHYIVISVDFFLRGIFEIGNHIVHVSFFKAEKCLLSDLILTMFHFAAETLCKWYILLVMCKYVSMLAQ